MGFGGLSKANKEGKGENGFPQTQRKSTGVDERARAKVGCDCKFGDTRDQLAPRGILRSSNTERERNDSALNESRRAGPALSNRSTETATAQMTPEKQK